MATSRRDADLELALFVPYVGPFERCRVDLDARCLRVTGAWATVQLSGLTEEALDFVRTQPQAVFLIGIDGLSQPSAGVLVSEIQAQDPSADPRAHGALRLNGFLSRALRRGDLSIQRHRVGVRQSDIEAFLRKTLRAIALARQSSSAEDDLIIDMSTAADSADPTQDIGPEESGAYAPILRDGRVNLAQAVLASREQVPLVDALCLDTIQPCAATHASDPQTVFALARLLGMHELALMLDEPKGFWRHAASASLALHGQAQDTQADGAPVSSDVLQAVDSVFLQSFCDVYALSICHSVFDRARVLTLIDQVLEARRRSQDAGDYSLAPLSYDTLAAVEILKAHVDLGLALGGPLRVGIWLKSLWMSAEGTAAWMEKHEVGGHLATSIGATMEALCLDVARPRLERIAEALGV